MSAAFYVYTHSKPGFGGDPVGAFYVGKGLKRRVHCFRKSPSNRHYAHVVQKYDAKNIEVDFVLCESEQAVLDLEQALIADLRGIGAELTNLTAGGEGTSGYKFSPESKARIGEVSRANWQDLKYRSKVLGARVGKMSARTPAKLEAACVNAEKARAALLDPQVKEVARLKNSVHTKALWQDPDYAARMAVVRKTVWTEERKAAMGSQTRGRVRVTNGTLERNVLAGEASLLEAEGWYRGRKPRKSSKHPEQIS